MLTRKPWRQLAKRTLCVGLLLGLLGTAVLPPASYGATGSQGGVQAVTPDFKQQLADAMARLQERPNDYQSLATVARILTYDVETRPQSFHYFERALTENPQANDLRVDFGKNLMWEKRYDQAEIQLTQVLNQEPNNGEALTSLARLLSYQPVKRSRSFPYFRRALQVKPENNDLRIEFVQNLMYERRYDEATTELEAFLKREPNHAQANQMLADLLAHNPNRQADSYQYFERFLSVNPKDEALFLQYGSFLESQKQFEKAADIYRQGLKSLPRSAALSKRLAQVTSWQPQKRSEAFPLFEEALGIAPEDTALRLDYANNLGWSGRYREAIDQYNQVLQREPDNLQALIGKGKVALWKGDFRLSSATFDEVLAMEPMNQEALICKSQIHQYQGMPVTALRWVPQPETVSMENPPSEAYLLQQVASAWDAQRYDKAAAAFNQIPTQLNDIWLQQQRNILGQRIRWDDWKFKLQTGYEFQTETGDPLNKLSINGFPILGFYRINKQNDIGFGFTPRILKAGQVPGIADTVGAFGYSLLYNTHPTDRFYFSTMGEMTDFTNSDQVAFTFSNIAKYVLHDRFALISRFSRLPIDDSLLSYAGYPFNDRFWGQVRNNAFMIGFNSIPIPKMDLGFQYEFGYLTGSNIQDNRRNQFLGTLGRTFTHRKLPNQWLRLGYIFLHFSYDHDASGFPSQQPFLPPEIGVGGYFSPAQFYLNAWSAQLGGKLFMERLRYEIGGSLGVQNINRVPAFEPKVTSLSSSAFGSIIARFTDWLELETQLNYTNAGNAYNRLRLLSFLNILI